jgi:hypothetical protein
MKEKLKWLSNTKDTTYLKDTLALIDNKNSIIALWDDDVRDASEEERRVLKECCIKRLEELAIR